MTRIERISGTRAHTRYRTADGKRVPGVTTIIGVMDKPHLVKWANNLGLEGIDSTAYRDRLADVGTLAHHLIECHWKGEEPQTDAYSAEHIGLASNAFLKYLAWEQDKTIEPILVEAQLVSEQYRYGGTIDFYGLVNGTPTIVDLKTSKAIYDTHLYQVAAYSQLLKEAGYEVEQVRVLQVGRTEDEDFSERILSRVGIEPRWEVFRLCRELYEALKEARK